MSRPKRTQPARTTRTASRLQAPPFALSEPRATSASAPESWHIPASLDSILRDGISAEFFAVPEGVVDVVRCRHCGGRSEHLTVSQRSASEATAYRSGQLTSRRHAEFAAGHAQCATHPRAHQMEPAVRTMANFLAEEASKILRTGDGVQQAAYLMHATGTVSFEYPASSPGCSGVDVAYRTAVAELHCEVRQYIREHALTVQGVAHVGACWVSADPRAMDGTIGAASAPDRVEVVAVTVVTPTDGRLVYLPAAPVRDARLSALLRAPRWRPLSGRAPLTDGLLAVACGTSA